MGETLQEDAERLKSKNCVTKMWLQFLEGICSGLCPLLKEKLLPVGESVVKTMLGRGTQKPK